MFPFGRLLVLIFSLVVPAIFDPIAYLYLFSQQINKYMSGRGGGVGVNTFKSSYECIASLCTLTDGG